MSLTFEYELTDVRAAQAARESWIATSRKQFTPGFVFLVLVVTIIMMVAIAAGVRGWLLLFWSAAPIVFLLMVILWLVMWWWLPRLVFKKIEHLAHRKVSVTLSDEKLELRTASEQMAVDWNVLDELRELPNYWLLCLKGSNEIALPKDSVPADALTILRDKAARVTTRS